MPNSLRSRNQNALARSAAEANYLNKARNYLSQFMHYQPTGAPANVGEMTQFGLNVVPGVGDVIALDDAKRAYQQGNIGEAAFNAITAIPAIGDIATAAKVGLPAIGGIGGIVGGMMRHGKNVPTGMSRQAGTIGDASKLPMDEASRLARAKELGFGDEVMYHGTTGELSKFDPTLYGSSTQAESARHGVWLTSSPDEAGEYADLAAHNKIFTPIKEKMDLLEAQARTDPSKWDEWERLQAQWEKLETIQEKGQAIYPLKVRKGKYLEYDAKGNMWGDVEADINKMINKAKSEGYDGFELKNIKDMPYSGSAGRPTTHKLIFDPKNIRSAHAKFDPAKKASANILAGGAAATIGARAAIQDDQRK